MSQKTAPHQEIPQNPTNQSTFPQPQHPSTTSAPVFVFNQPMMASQPTAGRDTKSRRYMSGLLGSITK